MVRRIMLPNECSMSTPSVYPKDWKSGGKILLNEHWRIQYYFYDPNKGRKLIVVKGMNQYHTLTERRAITKALLDDEVLQNSKGYNPFLKRYVYDRREYEDLHEEMYFVDAFRAALDKLTVSDVHRDQIRYAINRLEKVSKRLGMQRITIENLRRRELKKILENCNLPDNYFNKYRTYISSLFDELLEYECCDVNIVRDIRKKKITVKKREILSVEEHDLVMNYLEENYYEFYRFAQVFFYSGARVSELMRVQKKDVEIEKQEFKVTIYKGKQSKETIKVILGPALKYWQELLDEAKTTDFLFSKNLVPGQISIAPNQITRRWNRLVKKSDKIQTKRGRILKVTADFYSLKHSFLDSLPEDIAMKIASHTSGKTTAIYRVNQEKRDREVLKLIEL